MATQSWGSLTYQIGNEANDQSKPSDFQKVPQKQAQEQLYDGWLATTENEMKILVAIDTIMASEKNIDVQLGYKTLLN